MNSKIWVALSLSSSVVPAMAADAGVTARVVQVISLVRSGTSYTAPATQTQVSQSYPATAALTLAAAVSQSKLWDRVEQLTSLHSADLHNTPYAVDGAAFMQYSQRTSVKDTPSYAGTAAARFWQWADGGIETQDYISKAELGGHTLKLRAYYDTTRNPLVQYSGLADYNDYSIGFGLEDRVRVGTSNRLQLAFSSKTEVHRENLIGQPVQTDRDRVQKAALDDSQMLGERWTLATGLSYQRSKMLSEQNYVPGASTLLDPVDSKSAWDGQAMLHLDMGDGDALHVGVARKSRFATIKDRYAYRMVTAIANPALQPETARRLEIGYAGWVADWHTEFTVFHSQVHNLIQSNLLGNTISQQQNVGRVAVDGLELSLQNRLGLLEVGGNYALMKRVNLSDSSMLTDAPRSKLFAYAALDMGSGWTLNGSVDASSERYASAAGTRRSSGYAIASAKAGYRVGKSTTLEVGVRNLLDRVYSYTDGFPEPGRSGFIQLSHGL